MLVIPRLELVGGVASRIASLGALGSDDPLAAARAWAADGFSRLQVVDRDAIAGRGSNLRLAEAVGRDGAIEVDLSAGSNSAEQIEACIDAGASRVVLGARALTEDDWLRSVAETFPGALIVETMVRERRVVTRGWVRTLPIDLLDLVDDLDGVPVAALVVAAPAGGGPELAHLEDVVEGCAFPVFVEDHHPTMSALRAFEHRGLAGVVIPGGSLATALDPRSVGNEFGR